MDTDIFIRFFWIVIAVFGGIVLLATVVKLREVWRCSKWLVTSGKVVDSKVESRRRGGLRQGEDTDTMGNYPLVVFEYTVEGQNYKGKRISVGEQMPDFQVAETLGKYPVGAAVDVFYNPLSPGQSVLERDLPPNFIKAFAGIFVFLFACAIILPIGIREFTERIAGYIDKPENGAVVSVLLGLFIFVVLLTVALHRQLQKADGWPSTAGKVVSSFVEAALTVAMDGSTRSVFRRTVVYQAKVIYSYQVRGRTYQGDRLTLGRSSAGSVVARVVNRFKAKTNSKRQPDFVDSTPDKRGNSDAVPAWVTGRVLSYPAGMAIKVFYNPENPAEAIVEKQISGILWLYMVAAVLLLLALKLAGVIGHW
jgi:Protein of unknown function (DUF3592)